MKRPTVLLADDHIIFADGLRKILEREFAIVGSVQDGRTMVSETLRLKPDVTVADISMPLLNGFEATRQIRKADPKAKIVFFHDARGSRRIANLRTWGSKSWQTEVLHLVAEGRTAKEIAGILNLSHRTIEFHKNRIMEELGVHSTAELTRFAIQHRVLPL